MVSKRTGNTKQKQVDFLSQKQEKIQARELAAPPHTPLKLKVQDTVDLHVMSALLQDAIVPGTNIHYDPLEKTFILMVNRFCWEESPERLNHKKVYGRIACCVQFHHVDRVQHQNFDPQKMEEHYNLLSVDGDVYSGIVLTFSGNSKIKLSIRDVSFLMTDLDDMWYTTTCPEHRLTPDAA